jgi:hypothetical protein
MTAAIEIYVSLLADSNVAIQRTRFWNVHLAMRAEAEASAEAVVPGQVFSAGNTVTVCARFGAAGATDKYSSGCDRICVIMRSQHNSSKTKRSTWLCVTVITQHIACERGSGHSKPCVATKGYLDVGFRS